MRSHRSARRAFSGFAVLILLVGMVVAGEAGAATDGTTRSVAAPVGIWSGTGDHPDQFNDYTVIAVMEGDPGSQPAFFAEYVVGGACSPGPGEFGPASMLGTATFADGSVTVTGDLICADTGDLFQEGFGFTVAYDEEADTLTAGDYPGPFERRCNGSNSDIVGTAGNDVLNGTADHDVIDGLGGNDTIKGKGGMDILCGQDGNDRLIGEDDIDVLVGDAGKDTLKGGTGPDLLLGGGGNDKLKGQTGDDAMFGDAGKDKLMGAGGDDYADGGGGADNCTAETELSC